MNLDTSAAQAPVFHARALQEALRLAEEYGLPVFPCRPDKSPYTQNGFKDASRNIEKIDEMFKDHRDALVAVPTGSESGVVVVDIDKAGAGWHRANGGRLAAERIHQTPHGYHLLYRMPAIDIRNSASKLATGVDVRGNGGYLIWWPAHGYKAVGNLARLIELPEWLLIALTCTRPSPALLAPSNKGSVLEGGRSDYLSREAFRLRKQGSAIEQIVSIISAINHARCEPPLLDDEVLAIAKGKAGITPSGVTLEDFRAYMPMHSYIFVPNGDLWPAVSVNSRIPEIPGPDGKPIKPNVWLDAHRPVEQMTWAPGYPMIIADRLVSNGGWIDSPGCNCFNLYLPPTTTPGNASNAARWVDHVNVIYPADAEHIIAWLAHRVQKPEIKCNHVLVLGGAQGIGKDTLLEPAKYAVGPWNVNEISPTNLLGRFNGFVKSVILRISEARDLGNVDRYAFYEHLKVFAAAPPDVLRCDEKHLKEHAVMNVCGVVITTNHQTDGVYLPSDDRRHYVAWSDKNKEDFDLNYWREIYGWYNNGGLQDVAAYLATLDISGFDPKAPPPKTPAFWAIVDANRSPEDAQMADVLDFIGTPDAITLSDLQHPLADSEFREWLADRTNRRQIPHRLESAGYVAVRSKGPTDGLWVINRRRQQIYARKGLSVRERFVAASHRHQVKDK